MLWCVAQFPCPLSEYTIVCYLFSIDGHLDCFLFLCLLLKINVQSFFGVDTQEQNCWVIGYANVQKNKRMPNCFPKVLCQFTIPSTPFKSASSSTSSGDKTASYCGIISGNKMVSYCGLILYFLIISEIEELFVFTTYIPSNIFNAFFHFYYLSCSSIYMFCMLIFCR